jgi:hypothetical protein
MKPGVPPFPGPQREGRVMRKKTSKKRIVGLVVLVALFAFAVVNVRFGINVPFGLGFHETWVNVCYRPFSGGFVYRVFTANGHIAFTTLDDAKRNANCP